jgi:hypothetical protein
MLVGFLVKALAVTRLYTVVCWNVVTCGMTTGRGIRSTSRKPNMVSL